MRAGPDRRATRRASSRGTKRALQDLRIRLHYLAGRREDRLCSTCRRALARSSATPTRRDAARERALMQRYYRAAKAVTQLNTILLQNLEARLVPAARRAPRSR